MKEQIIEILKDVTGMDNITEDMSFTTDIALTSMTIIKMAYDIQDKLGIEELPVESLYDVETVKELIEVVESCK